MRCGRPFPFQMRGETQEGGRFWCPGQPRNPDVNAQKVRFTGTTARPLARCPRRFHTPQAAPGAGLAGACPASLSPASRFPVLAPRAAPQRAGLRRCDPTPTRRRGQGHPHSAPTRHSACRVGWAGSGLWGSCPCQPCPVPVPPELTVALGWARGRVPVRWTVQLWNYRTLLESS